MLAKLIRIMTGKSQPELGARSPKWPAVRAAHLKTCPACAVCGETKDVSVHHKKPFHLYPDLELDQANLVTLCERFDHHFLFGHGQDWRAYNARVDLDCANARELIKQRRYA